MAAHAQRIMSAIGSSTRRVVKSYDEDLPCTLTHEERWDAGIASAEAVTEYDRLEAEKKLFNQTITKKMKELRKKISAEAKAAATGKVAREVRVEDQFDLMEERVFRVRTDTGEILSERGATDAERQESLDFGKGEAS